MTQKNLHEEIDNTKILLDSSNKRLKVRFREELSEEILDKIKKYSKENDAEKIICYVPEGKQKILKISGFETEGKIYGYFNGEDARCMSFFVKENRKKPCHNKDEISVKKLARKKDQKNKDEKTYDLRNAQEEDAEKMSVLFKKIFSSYPTPVYDSEYIKQTIKDNYIYKVVYEKDRIVAMASAEINREFMNAEITDCATEPSHRGKGLLSMLVQELEKDLIQEKIFSLYSLSRAANPGINRVLKKSGYEHTGRMIQNCNICGSYEDMNIWSKSTRTLV